MFLGSRPRLATVSLPVSVVVSASDVRPDDRSSELQFHAGRRGEGRFDSLLLFILTQFLEKTVR